MIQGDRCLQDRFFCNLKKKTTPIRARDFFSLLKARKKKGGGKQTPRVNQNHLNHPGGDHDPVILCHPVLTRVPAEAVGTQDALTRSLGLLSQVLNVPVSLSSSAQLSMQFYIPYKEGEWAFVQVSSRR